MYLNLTNIHIFQEAEGLMYYTSLSHHDCRSGDPSSQNFIKKKYVNYIYIKKLSFNNSLSNVSPPKCHSKNALVLLLDYFCI